VAAPCRAQHAETACRPTGSDPAFLSGPQCAGSRNTRIVSGRHSVSGTGKLPGVLPRARCFAGAYFVSSHLAGICHETAACGRKWLDLPDLQGISQRRGRKAAQSRIHAAGVVPRRFRRYPADGRGRVLHAEHDCARGSAREICSRCVPRDLSALRGC
jgi:hypothetical protein